MNRKNFLKITALGLPFIPKVFAQERKNMNDDVLILYYSWSGNTRYIANAIQKYSAATLVEIKEEKPYSRDYNTVVQVAKSEVNSEFKPPLKTKLGNLEKYKLIIVGSPNWWGTIASPIRTILSSYDFSGKTIATFITHEGSHMGNSIKDINKICNASKVLDGLAIRGGSVRRADKDVEKWLNQIGVKKA